MSDHPYSERVATPDEWRAALQSTNFYLDERPNDAGLWCEKGNYYERAVVHTVPRRTRFERVLLWHRQALRLDPANWVHWCNCGRALSELQRFEDAKHYAEKAAELAGGSNVAPWEWLSYVCDRLTLHAESAAARQKAASLGVEVKMLGDVRHIEKRGDDTYEKVAAQYRSDAGSQAGDAPMPVWHEAADPVLSMLDFDIGHVLDLQLRREAEQLCVTWEFINGRSNLTASYLGRIRQHVQFDPERLRDLLWTEGQYPAVEMAGNTILRFLYHAQVDHLKQEGLLKHVTPDDIEETDGHVCWLLSMLPPDAYVVKEDPLYVVRPIPVEVQRVWNLATANLLLALGIGDSRGEALSSATLARFYEKVGSVRLPLLLNRRGAAAAEQAGMADHALSLHMRCAAILQKNQDFGPSLEHLLRAENFSDQASSAVRVALWVEIAEGFAAINAFSRAGTYLEKALADPEVGEDLAQRVRSAVELNEQLLSGQVARVRHPMIVREKLQQKHYEVGVPTGVHIYVATSEHEYYDGLVVDFQGTLQRRRSMLGRDIGFEYMEGYHELVDALITTGVRLGLASQALMFLEQQKNIILNSRVRFLLRVRPEGVPESIWTDFKQSFGSLQAAVERDPAAIAADTKFATGQEIAEAVQSCLWKMRWAAPAEFRAPLESLLGSRDLPRKVTSREPAVVLEFFSGRDSGVCFLIDPSDPEMPEAIPLADAGQAPMSDLTARTLGVIEKWTHASKLGADPLPLERDFLECLREMDARLGSPIIEALRARKGVRRLAIVPHRCLHALPLNLLGLADLGVAVCERYDLVLAPSFDYLAATRGWETQNRKMVVVSDSVPQCGPFCRNPARDCFALPGARMEGNYVAQAGRASGYEVEHLEGESATCNALTEAARDASILHLACHNVISDVRIEDSGVVLHLDDSAGAGCFASHTGSVSGDRNRAAGEILSLKRLWQTGDFRRCRLLHLSGCSTGMTQWRLRSDEFYGLPNGFLCAGVENIVCSLWATDDVAAMAFTQAFYRGLLSQETIDAARVSRAFSDAAAWLKDVRSADLLDSLAGSGMPLPDDVRRRVEGAGSGPVFGSPLHYGAWRLVGSLS